METSDRTVFTFSLRNELFSPGRKTYPLRAFYNLKASYLFSDSDCNNSALQINGNIISGGQNEKLKDYSFVPGPNCSS